MRNLFCISVNNASEHYRVNQFGKNVIVHLTVSLSQLSSTMRYSVYMEVRLLQQCMMYCRNVCSVVYCNTVPRSAV